DVGDEAERATRETENSLELRTRDRYRKLISKIERRCVASRKGVTASAKRPTRRSASTASTHGRSPRCRWMRRSVANTCRSRWATESRVGHLLYDKTPPSRGVLFSRVAWVVRS